MYKYSDTFLLLKYYTRETQYALKGLISRYGVELRLNKHASCHFSFVRLAVSRIENVVSFSRENFIKIKYYLVFVKFEK